jgi:KDO2-lipid IV(A) lauroyltransferase
LGERAGVVFRAALWERGPAAATTTTAAAAAAAAAATLTCLPPPRRLGLALVIIAAHHGAWELAGHATAMCFDRPFYALAKPSKSARLTRVLNEIRERLGMQVLWTDSKTLLKDMMAVSSRHEHLGFVMDQRPGNRQGGHVCEFLGVKDTHMVTGPAMMAVRKNMPVCGIYMVRTGLCKYHFYVTEVLPLNHGLDNEQRVAQMMADDMSRMIRLYPEQWAWNYRRWKK